MRAHFRYLKYVLIHKFYVWSAGWLLARLRGEYRWRLFWRLVFHDMSKFSRAEWGPYVTMFYGPELYDAALKVIQRPAQGGYVGSVETAMKRAGDDIKRARQYDFNVAWLHHQHVNDHHWQHWLLREDSGANIQLLPPAYVVDEMVADWCGAGQKILKWPHLAECIAETIAWYTKMYAVIQLRPQARQRVEEDLAMLAHHFGLIEAAKEALAGQAQRVSLTIPLGGTQRATS
jgi:hypothetical protein